MLVLVWQVIGESIRVRRCAPRREGCARGWIEFSEAIGVAVGRVADDLGVSESRSSGAIRSERAAAVSGLGGWVRAEGVCAICVRLSAMPLGCG
jgi:hypothetical protein